MSKKFCEIKNKIIITSNASYNISGLTVIIINPKE